MALRTGRFPPLNAQEKNRPMMGETTLTGPAKPKFRARVHFLSEQSKGWRYHVAGGDGGPAMRERSWRLLPLTWTIVRSRPSGPTVLGRSRWYGVQDKNPRRPARTEIGRTVAKKMDAPAPMVDSIVGWVAGEKLKNFHPRGNPH